MMGVLQERINTTITALKQSKEWRDKNIDTGFQTASAVRYAHDLYHKKEGCTIKEYFELFGMGSPEFSRVAIALGSAGCSQGGSERMNKRVKQVYSKVLPHVLPH